MAILTIVKASYFPKLKYSMINIADYEYYLGTLEKICDNLACIYLFKFKNKNTRTTKLMSFSCISCQI